MSLQWITSLSAGALYAARAMYRGRELVDADLAQVLQPAVDELLAELARCSCPTERWLDHALALAADFDDPRALAEAALAKTIGQERCAEIECHVSDRALRLCDTLLSARPRLADEMPLRIEPLRSQWEARGPGLLAAMRRKVNHDLVPDSVSLVLVPPLLGGGGVVHASYNRVTFEAVLANPIAQLPEVLRLGCLIAQLNFDAAQYDDELGWRQIETVGPPALVPVTLAAGEEVELARCDAASIELALEAWLDCRHMADTIRNWWQAWHGDAETGWLFALVALQGMLE